MKKTALLTSLLMAAPYVAFAAGDLDSLLTQAGGILNRLIPILITFALVIFFWGLIKYIMGSGEGHKEGQSTMIAGLISLFIMLSVFGIIGLAQNTLHIGPNDNNNLNIPQINTTGN